MPVYDETSNQHMTDSVMIAWIVEGGTQYKYDIEIRFSRPSDTVYVTAEKRTGVISSNPYHEYIPSESFKTSRGWDYFVQVYDQNDNFLGSMNGVYGWPPEFETYPSASLINPKGSQSDPYLISDNLTPSLQLQYVQESGEPLHSYQVQIYDDQGGQVVYDTGEMTPASAIQNGDQISIQIPAGTLQYGKRYRWRARTSIQIGQRAVG